MIAVDPTEHAAEAALLAYLDAAHNREATADFADLKLAPLCAVLRLLPAPPAPCTVGGTKGKGSTVRLIETALRSADRDVVAFTSPHVQSVCERWRVAGMPVPASALLRLARRTMQAERDAGVDLTYFERTFAIAVLLAAERPGCAFLVEVGLGGRLDCANALDAAVAVITHLSHDHRDVLGPTLLHIAREKLAIARPGQPLLIAPQSLAATLAIARALPSAAPGAAAQWIAAPRTRIALALPGEHQQGNAATALAAARLLEPQLDVALACNALATAGLAARCQLVAQDDRRVLVDGAHNGPSIAATLAVAADILRPGWTLVLGCARDKEADEILAAISAARVAPARIFRCGYASPRARRGNDWPDAATAWPFHTGVRAALVDRSTDCCVTGSFYLAGEALAVLGAQGVLPG